MTGTTTNHHHNNNNNHVVMMKRTPTTTTRTTTRGNENELMIIASKKSFIKCVAFVLALIATLFNLRTMFQKEVLVVVVEPPSSTISSTSTSTSEQQDVALDGVHVLQDNVVVNEDTTSLASSLLRTRSTEEHSDAADDDATAIPPNPNHDHSTTDSIANVDQEEDEKEEEVRLRATTTSPTAFPVLPPLTIPPPSFIEENNNTLSPLPSSWPDVKLLLYMTTHLPEEHVAFLPCWKDALERLELFQYNAHVLLYTSVLPTPEQLTYFPLNHTTVKVYTNPGYQDGAMQAMVDPFLDENQTWFDEYDWVIRLNPDVLIRHDSWLIQTMLNTSVDMIVHECVTECKYTETPTLHTDFFAFRPWAVDRDRLLQAPRDHAEPHFTTAFRHLYDARRFAYVEGGKNAVEGTCRIEGVHSPVLHVHELSNHCPYYYNITKEGFYR